MRSIDTQLSSGALAPVYKTAGAAGADLFANLPNGPVWIPPGEIRKIPSGVHFDIRDTGLAVLLMPRSSLGEKRIKLANTIGLIDSDYQGDLSMLLENNSSGMFAVHHGDRLAQVAFFRVEQVDFNVVSAFSGVTLRGTGGFGSTGKGG